VWADHLHEQYLRRQGHTEAEIAERLRARVAQRQQSTD
jgi:AhpD family alkylhydroperoxidase